MDDLLTQFQESGRLTIAHITAPVATLAPAKPAAPEQVPTHLRFATRSARMIEKPKGRSIEASWPLDGQEHGEPGRFVRAYAHHSTSGKAYFGGVVVVTRTRDELGESETHLPFDTIQLPQERGVARYSFKGLQTYFRGMLATDVLFAAIDAAIAKNEGQPE